MAIVQISKMQQRAGNLVDLPQLDNGELGWAADANRLFIGRSGNTFTSENIEVLTSYSAISLSQITGSDSGNLNITAAENGQLLTYVSSTDTWENYTGNSSQLGGGKLQLGDVANIVMDGGASGYVLQTDGLGNLTWTAQTGGSGGGGTGGSNTTVQFNDSGLSNGVAAFTFNKTSNTLTVSTGNIFTNNVYASSSMGIGTSSPSYKLQVDGGRALFSPTSEAYAVGLRYNTSTNGVWLGSPSANAFQISNFGGTAYLNIDANGNVGIGTTQLNSKISFPLGTNTVMGMAAGSAHQAVNAGYLGMAISDGGGFSGVFVYNTWNGSFSSQDIRFNTAQGDISSSTERMRIKEDGNVGIGNNAPTNTLSVNGTTYVSGNSTIAGQIISSIATGTAPLVVTSTTQVANLSVATAGTVTTNAQPNITSTGTLTTLNVSGATYLATSSGNVGVGTASPAVKFAIVSTDAALLPVGNTTQRPTGANGYIRYNSQTTSFEGYSGGAWGSIGGGATGAGGDQIFYENGQTVNNSYTIAAGKNAGTFGPVTIATGAVVTVPTGSVWSIV